MIEVSYLLSLRAHAHMASQGTQVRVQPPLEAGMQDGELFDNLDGQSPCFPDYTLTCSQTVLGLWFEFFLS